MPAHEREDPRARVRILSAQALALGLTTAWITIPASAIFLATFGSKLLPVTYIGAGGAGAVSSIALSRAFRRLPVVAVASRVVTALSIVLLVAWILLWRADANWVAFVPLVVVPLLIPIGFVFIVGEAGLLLDVRSLKAHYARVVAGFALGLVAGGLAVPSLLAVVGNAEHLLLAAAAAAMSLRLLMRVARHRYPQELDVVEADDDGLHRPDLRVLARHRYVLLIVAFQVLSAVESQWLDFLVLDRAARRYDDRRVLAQFVGRFSVIAYGADILFLLVVAGILLRRFGLRYGLRANPVGVTVLVVAVIGTTVWQGANTASVFVLVVAARVADLTLSDGAARTSLSAAYQAVPARMRSVAAATIEGLAVPVAIGVSGVVLLAVQAAGAAGGLVLPVLTAAVLLTWTAVAGVLAKEYGVNLLARLRGRTLDPADLTVDGGAALVVVDRLVDSTDERDVRLGLELLGAAEHPDAAVGGRRRRRRRLRRRRPRGRCGAGVRHEPPRRRTRAATHRGRAGAARRVGRLRRSRPRRTAARGDGRAQ